MTIDLTPAELREFAHSYAAHFETHDLKWNGVVVNASDLARALADTMEERDKALADLEAAREAINRLNEIVEGVQEVCATHLPPDGMSAGDAMSIIIEMVDGPAQRQVQGLPAVRAAWEGK